MLKTAKIGRRGIVKMPDTFVSTTAQNTSNDVDIYFGANYDIVIITSHNKVLSADNKKRISILTEEKG